MTGKKILIVEDEVDLRTLMREELTKAGHEVFEAENGSQALSVLKTIRPDLIISDVVMPEMDGNVFYKTIRQDQATRDIPVIIISARIKMRDYFEVMQVDGFVEKPFRLKILLEKVDEVMSKRLGVSGSAGQGNEQGGSQFLSIDLNIPRGVENAPKAEQLPLRKGQEDSANKKSTGPRDNSARDSLLGSQKNKGILLAEENTRVVTELKTYLIQMGYTVDSVGSIQECIDAVYRLQPRVVLLNDSFQGARAMDIADKIKLIPSSLGVAIIIYQSVFEQGNDGEVIVEKLSHEGSRLLSKVQKIISSSDQERGQER